MTAADPRVGAWLQAQALVVRAQELRAQRDHHTAPRTAPEPLPEAYWLCLAEAHVLADLAGVSDHTAVGVMVTAEAAASEEAQARADFDEVMKTYGV